MSIEIFCDGACSQGAANSNADQIGGYAAIIKFEDSKVQEIAFGETGTTNNRMEMMGAIIALRIVNVIYESKSCDISITSDSAYLVNGMTNWIKGWQEKGWKTASKKPVKNQDLWQELIQLTNQHKVRFKWIKGHASSPENNRCDTLAVEAIERKRKEIKNASSNASN